MRATKQPRIVHESTGSQNRAGSNWHSGLTNVRAGDVIGWRFGNTDPGDDHVSVLIGATTALTVIEGNVDSYPSKVQQNTYPAEQYGYQRLRRRLIARPWPLAGRRRTGCVRRCPWRSAGGAD
jgi:hypothetical protein